MKKRYSIFIFNSVLPDLIFVFKIYYEINSNKQQVEKYIKCYQIIKKCISLLIYFETPQCKLKSHYIISKSDSGSRI